MAKEKVSFVMFYEWETIFDRLSDAQLGALLRAMRLLADGFDF